MRAYTLLRNVLRGRLPYRPSGASRALAIYHFSVKVISRATGAARWPRRPIARPRSCTTNGWDGRTTSPTRPGWCIRRFSSRTARPRVCWTVPGLWNEVEAGEKRKDAQLAREIEIALPRELSQARGDPAGAGLRPRAVRGARHGGGPERALGPGGGR